MTQTDPILCIGSALWDIIARTERPMKPGYDVPGQIDRQLGGVALNVALAIRAHGLQAAVLTAIGEDPDGDSLIAALAEAGIDMRYATRVSDPTDSYMAIESQGDVFAAVADCVTLERAGDTIVAPLRDGTLAAADRPWRGAVVIDGNLSEEVLFSISAHHDLRHASMYLVPASPGKAERMRRVLRRGEGTIVVNIHEAGILCQEEFRTSTDAALGLRALGAQRAIVTNSARTACLAEEAGLVERDPPPVVPRTATGAGDAFLAGFICAEVRGATSADALDAAIASAAAHISQESP
ncbi:PfkB family carbohydrate kinase [Oceanomicrobium pacificus]|uniref:Kinase n=1 Tax=Oceanomicrobium pacificus TaxID=2692916 RepID=A0A6B0TMN5_9RHOB|nr:PfkB family carbohydrate kinase [Oceanomicrobium pacificus]MXU65840.1 kinase [Oceanomicrobium pacificus]